MQGPFIFSVRELTRYIKTTLERERALQGILVRGEISNCKYHSSGHLYFTLKDDACQIPCVMWRDRVFDQSFRCENGMRITAEGSIAIYERGGYYQLTVYSMQADGVGNLYLAFEQLKRKLEAEGLFDRDRKRPLPSIPRRIALLTSPTGAVVHDFVTVSTRRWRGRNIILIPTAVQGPLAPASIRRSLQQAEAIDGVDVIVLARGGGSFEELACFNDEGVVRAIVDSSIPVVSAIGHETDFTIADFVADLRAPTPSAAAEMVIPDLRGVTEYLHTMEDRIFSRMRRQIATALRDIDRVASSPVLRNPKLLIQERQQTIDVVSERIMDRMRTRLIRARHHFESVDGRITALDPRGVLLRGYALVSSPTGNKIISSVEAARTCQEVDIQFFDGTLRASIDQQL